MGILIRNNILNQKGNPAWYEDTLAARPIANLQGRMFVDTDVPSTGIYRDTGSSWVAVADSGAGTTATLQQVTTNGSSTNVGISVSANGIGIGTTIPGINRLDIHTGTGINATFNGTGTTNAALQLQSAGVGKWTIQNNYNSAANDFVLTDVANSVNRLTIKNTGLATYNGFLNVANNTTAQNIQISGTAPAYTIVEGTGNANTASIGVASIANNFIQGSVEGDFCLVSQSTVAKRLLLAVQSASNSAICISASNNILLNTLTDAGYKLDCNGTGRFSGALTVSGNINANSGALFVNNGTYELALSANGTYSGPAIVATTGTDALYISPNGRNTIIGANGVGFPCTLAIRNTSSSNTAISVENAAASTQLFKIVDSGVATFSNSVNIGNTITAAVAVASTHKVSILIGGVQYYLLASNV